MNTTDDYVSNLDKETTNGENITLEETNYSQPNCVYGSFICQILIFHQTYFPLFSQILLCTVGAFSLIGNITILITVGSKVRSLMETNQFNHENSFVANFYFGSISLADLIATLVYLPSQVNIWWVEQGTICFKVYVNISPQWRLGLLYCKIHILIGRMCDTFSVYSMMFMARSNILCILNGT